jgi:hypothetical protein
MQSGSAAPAMRQSRDVHEGRALFVDEESLQNALRAYFLLVNFTMGQVSYEVRGPNALDARLALRRGAISVAELPLVARAMSTGAWDFDASFEFGLDVVISGLEYHSNRSSPHHRLSFK